MTRSQIDQKNLLNNIWITKMFSNDFKQINIYQYALHCYAVNTIDPAFWEFNTNLNDLQF